jgi:acetoacetate decarboxylase
MQDVFTTGFDQPVTAPLYPDPPYYYRGAQVLLGIYEAADSGAVARHLPPGVTVAEDPAICITWVCHYPFTTFGTYNELIQLVRVDFEGDTYLYCPLIYTDAEAPMAAGREIWGWCKKMADLRLVNGGDGPGFREMMQFEMERPTGKRLCTVTFSPEKPATMDDVGATPHLTLRFIPGAEAGSRPSVCELVRTEPATIAHSSADGSPMIWFGRCSVTMDSASVTDPMQDFAPGRMLPSLYGIFDWTLPQGRVVHDYLAEGQVQTDGERREVAVTGAAAGGAG